MTTKWSQGEGAVRAPVTSPPASPQLVWSVCTPGTMGSDKGDDTTPDHPMGLLCIESTLTDSQEILSIVNDLGLIEYPIKPLLYLLRFQF